MNFNSYESGSQGNAYMCSLTCTGPCQVGCMTDMHPIGEVAVSASSTATATSTNINNY